MARAGKLRKRWGPPRPHRFGCRDARRTKWGYLPRETKATDGTFGEVAQTIPPSCAHGGEAAGSWRNLTLANMGVASFRLGRRTSPFGYLSFAPKVLRGSKGNFFKNSPWRVPRIPPTNPNLKLFDKLPPASDAKRSDAGGSSYHSNYFNTFLHHVRFPQ